MKNRKLLESIADIAYVAGSKKFHSGNSRQDISEFILWAEEFERKNKNTAWDSEDYISEIEKFSLQKINNENAGLN